ncbi:hypothetical protein [Demequina salsinemoris]|uniref:hypothetical protein n=1 Tax=Demequina salsinemoris TaxID=577470 RepID=UPI00078119C0|nr:hypothetical protein [Demequina salsinemoris]
MSVPSLIPSSVPARSRLLSLGAIVALALAWLVAVPGAAQAATGTKMTVSLESGSDYVKSVKVWPGWMTVPTGETKSRRVSWTPYDKGFVGVSLNTVGNRYCSLSATITWTYQSGKTRTVVKEESDNTFRVSVGPHVASVDVDVVASDDCTLYSRAKVNWDGGANSLAAKVTGGGSYFRPSGSTLRTNLRPVDENMRIGFTLYTQKSVCVRMVDTYTGKVYADHTAQTNHKYRVPRNRTFDATVVACAS